MLSSVYNRPQIQNQADSKNYFPFSSQPSQGYLSYMQNTPHNPPNTLNNSSSTNVPKYLNTTSLQPKEPSKTAANPRTSKISTFPFNQHDSSQSLNKKRNDSHFTQISENFLQKKLKSSSSVFDNLLDGFQVLATHSPDEDELLSETDIKIQVFQDSKEGNYPWNALKHTSTNEQSAEPELTKALERLKNIKIQKHQNPRDSSYECKITFETPLVIERIQEEPSEPEEDSISSSKDQSSDGTASPTQTTEIDHHKIHERKKGLQAIKHSLEGIHPSDFDRLEPEVYLNDNLINFYLKFIENVLISEEMRKRCHFFNTYFMAKMLKLWNESNKNIQDHDNIYQEMKKWIKKVNLFEKDFIFIPVNINEHWDLIIICYPHRFFSQDNDLPFLLFFDSLCRMDNIYAFILFQFLSRELRTKMPEKFTNFALPKSFRFNLTTLPHYQHMLPKQSNLSDCGLYLLQYIEMFVYNQDHIMEQKEDIHKMRWFPRKLIEEKRKDMEKIIKDLQNHRIEVIDEYLDKRNNLIEKHSHEDHEYDIFNPEGFQKALKKTYPDRVFNEYDQRCLMLDYYFFNTLDYDELAKASKK
jgi:sentrin-specific protease 7